MTVTSMNGYTKYEFAFTTSSLRLKEMVLVAQAIIEERDIDFINELGNGKRKTGRKMLSELTKRIENLTPQQVKLLAISDLNVKRSIAFLAVCKTYGFIRDFVIEVLREKYLVYDFDITDGDYFSFFRQKVEQHPEMEDLTEETEKKIRQVTFKILEQAGIIESIKNKTIQPQIIDQSVIASITEEDADWLKIFFLNEMDF